MSGLAELPSDPIELARVPAQKLDWRAGGTEAAIRQRELDLGSLDEVAGELGFIGAPYFVDARLAFIIPASFDRSSEVRLTKFDGLTFEGSFTTFSRVAIGRIVDGAESVRALCMAFGRATLLPYFDELPETDILHVPVLAVQSIDPTPN